MAQPASVSSFPLADLHEVLAFEPNGDGPANRAQAELSLALDAGSEKNWSMGATLRFILASCGIFWAAVAIYALR